MPCHAMTFNEDQASSLNIHPSTFPHHRTFLLHSSPASHNFNPSLSLQVCLQESSHVNAFALPAIILGLFPMPGGEHSLQFISSTA